MAFSGPPTEICRMSDEISGSELLRRETETRDAVKALDAKFDEFAVTMEDRFPSREVMEIKLDKLSSDLDAREKLLMTQILDLQRSVELMRNWQHWIVRLIGGIVATVLITSIITSIISLRMK